MSYIPFTEEQKRQADAVDLEDFLLRHGERLLPSGRDKRLTSDHSVTIRGSQWYDHEAKTGGGPVAFLQTFRGLSYAEAVTELLGGERPYEPASQKPREAPREFALPPVSSTRRRLYDYLLQQRCVDRGILDEFTKRGMIYESCEKSKDGTKEYHNAVFVGTDESGKARHAHKRGLYTQGRSFRRNVEGSDRRCSFHWFGHSSHLYVFEGPVDLLAFLTLHPKGWKEHSYVALSGTSEHAMLWMLETVPDIRKVVLCLDHDAAGIEATGRLTDLLAERGGTDAEVLRPIWKDWDEDLKALNGLPAQPAEEHPQLEAAGPVCRRIAARCKAAKPEQAAERMSALLTRFRDQMHRGELDEAGDCAEAMAALALAAVLRECRQMGTALTPEQGAGYLQSQIQPHRNRGGLKGCAVEITQLVQNAVAEAQCPGVRTETQKRDVAASWLEAARACTQAAVKQAADQLKQPVQTQEQQETGMELTM